MNYCFLFSCHLLTFHWQNFHSYIFCLLRFPVLHTFPQNYIPFISLLLSIFYSDVDIDAKLLHLQCHLFNSLWLVFSFFPYFVRFSFSPVLLPFTIPNITKGLCFFLTIICLSTIHALYCFFYTLTYLSLMICAFSSSLLQAMQV